MNADEEEARANEPMAVVQEHLPTVPVAPAHGIAAIALSLAMKYHDINTVQDGALYQQFKLEGRNMRDLNLDCVFDTAERMEVWLLASQQRIAKIVVDALATPLPDEHDPPEAEDDGSEKAQS